MTEKAYADKKYTCTIKFDPAYDKTYKMTCAPSLIKVFAVRMGL